MKITAVDHDNPEVAIPFENGDVQTYEDYGR